MYQKYNLIVQNLLDEGLDARKNENVYTILGVLSPMPDTEQLVVVIPLTSPEVVQWGQSVPQAERYAIRTLAKSESTARSLHDTVLTALPLPLFRGQGSIQALPKSRDFYIYQREFRVSPNAT